MPFSSEDSDGSRKGADSSAAWIATGLRTIETYSLDVAAGVVGAAIFLQSFAETGPVPWTAVLCLGCAAVAVYNIDHLVDSRDLRQAVSPRRARHRGRRRSMAWLAGLAMLAGAATVPWLPGRILLGGALLVAYMGAYFAGVLLGIGGVPKRLAAAIGWTAAAALPALATAEDPTSPRLLAAVAILAGTAWLNLQSYAIADGPGEGCPDDRPGPLLRLATVTGVALLLSAAIFRDPAHLVPWLALASTVVLQVALPGLPSGLVHPLGEWGFALLALVGLGR